MRACGVSARGLTVVLVVELVSLAIVSGIVGLICGYVVAAFLLPDVAASLRGLYGAQVPGQLTLKASWWLSGLGMSVLGALLAAGAGLYRVYRLPVLAAAQPYAWQQSQQRWLKQQGMLALMVVLAAGGMFLLWGFPCIGISGACGIAAGGGAGIAGTSWRGIEIRAARDGSPAGQMVLGRQPAATARLVTGAHGPAACARR